MNKKLISLLVLISVSAGALANSGIESMATTISASMASSIGTLLSKFEKVFFGLEFSAVVLFIKQNPKAVISLAAVAAMIYVALENYLNTAAGFI